MRQTLPNFRTTFHSASLMLKTVPNRLGTFLGLGRPRRPLQRLRGAPRRSQRLSGGLQDWRFGRGAPEIPLLEPGGASGPRTSKRRSGPDFRTRGSSIFARQKNSLLLAARLPPQPHLAHPSKLSVYRTVRLLSSSFIDFRGRESLKPSIRPF